jgi:UDP-N-acetylglucosamine 2-epimerase
MKVLTILGTRPELIRLCLIVKKLDDLCDQVLVHTGQNYDPNLNDIFIDQLGIRKPDYYLDAKGSFGEQPLLRRPRTRRKQPPDYRQPE